MAKQPPIIERKVSTVPKKLEIIEYEKYDYALRKYLKFVQITAINTGVRGGTTKATIEMPREEFVEVLEKMWPESVAVQFEEKNA